MRIWHWKLIPVLPRQQLQGQWRELSLIARNLRETGMPNHILVNPVCEYPIEEFYGYCQYVKNELERRGFNVLAKNVFEDSDETPPFFEFWHNEQYLLQCYVNLQEKHDRGGIPYWEWKKVKEFMQKEAAGFNPCDLFDWQDA